MSGSRSGLAGDLPADTLQRLRQRAELLLRQEPVAKECAKDATTGVSAAYGLAAA
jgi:hypothetical protein